MLFNGLSELLRSSWNRLLPSCCLWCSLPVQRHDRQLCNDCLQALPLLPYKLCHYNLLWLPAVAQGLKKHKFDHLLGLSYYQHPYRHWIQCWKYSQDHAAGQLLSQQFILLLQQYRSSFELPEALLYVPMHKRKQRKRGFNQAQLLAIEASRYLQIPVLNVLTRTHFTEAQAALSRKSRQRNLRNAFTIDSTITLPAKVALIDDVVTTGATANEICRLLRRHGARHISLWTLAVTLAS